MRIQRIAIILLICTLLIVGAGIYSAARGCRYIREANWDFIGSYELGARIGACMR